MSALRRWLAELLCPEVFADARAYERSKAIMQDAYWWLGEFPDAQAAVRWSLDRDINYRRALDAPPVGEWPDGIEGFREALRRRQAEPSA